MNVSNNLLTEIDCNKLPMHLGELNIAGNNFSLMQLKNVEALVSL